MVGDQSIRSFEETNLRIRIPHKIRKRSNSAPHPEKKMTTSVNQSMEKGLGSKIPKIGISTKSNLPEFAALQGKCFYAERDSEITWAEFLTLHQIRYNEAKHMIKTSKAIHYLKDKLQECINKFAKTSRFITVSIVPLELPNKPEENTDDDSSESEDDLPPPIKAYNEEDPPPGAIETAGEEEEEELEDLESEGEDEDEVGNKSIFEPVDDEEEDIEESESEEEVEETEEEVGESEEEVEEEEGEINDDESEEEVDEQAEKVQRIKEAERVKANAQIPPRVEAQVAAEVAGGSRKKFQNLNVNHTPDGLLGSKGNSLNRVTFVQPSPDAGPRANVNGNSTRVESPRNKRLKRTFDHDHDYSFTLEDDSKEQENEDEANKIKHFVMQEFRKMPAQDFLKMHEELLKLKMKNQKYNWSRHAPMSSCAVFAAFRI